MDFFVFLVSVSVVVIGFSAAGVVLAAWVVALIRTERTAAAEYRQRGQDATLGASGGEEQH